MSSSAISHRLLLLLSSRRFCCLEDRLRTLRSELAAQGSAAGPALVDAALVLCESDRHAALPDLSSTLSDDPTVDGALRRPPRVLLATLEEINLAKGTGLAGAEPLPVGQPPSIQVYALGPFRVCVDGFFVQEWPSTKAKKIFKHLVAHAGRPVPKERLMELFWPDSNPDAARNSLNVAVYGVRKTLRQANPQFSYVLYRDGSYLLNPSVRLWCDREEFHRLYRRFDILRHQRNSGMVDVARQAIMLFEEGADLHREGALPSDQDVRDKYATMVKSLAEGELQKHRTDEAIDLLRRLIAVDPCDEETHRRLMVCYAQKGQVHLALRQYRRCFDALSRDLKIVPAVATTRLFQQIRARSFSETPPAT